MTGEIAVCVDGSAGSRAAFDWAVREAQLRGRPLEAVHVSSLPDEEALATWPYLREPAPDAWVKELTETHPGIRAKAVGLVGEAAPALLSFRSAADLTVLGLRGAGGFPELAVGSVAHRVAERSDSPVVLVPSGSRSAGGARLSGPVVLGIDARDPAGTATEFAFEAAHRRGTVLHAVHAWHFPSPAGQWMPYGVPEEDRGGWEDQEVQLLSDALRPWREKHPRVRVCQDVLLKTPPAALVEASSSAGLLVVGRAGTALGPTLRAVLEHTRCPVAVVPS
ncbi:universal stress protein [Streptomyces cavernae]|uniref:universal stress protein n=1 Tax=Streptomyces cavernae TaxID=2259034 RepID=UPI000FEB629F|nr:universal stress protein [Streptomyces cavernae]